MVGGVFTMHCSNASSPAAPAYAQTTLGEPVVGNGTASKSSTAYLDAGYFPGGDMCARIAAACSSTSPIPNGTTIDARAFTGAQVCASGNVTTMLKACTTATGNGGKLLLGTVSVYADGPSGGVNGNYSDNNSPASGIGTPAFLIPSKFWGIEGVSRGASAAGTQTSPTAGLGTFLSICTGTGTPVGNGGAGSGEIPPGPLPGGGTPFVCTTAFPKRSFGITSTSVATSGGVTTLTINVGSTLTSGINVYPGELVMVKGSGVASNNGTYKIQTISQLPSFVTVTVPSTTVGCSSPTTCGTLFLGTPILGFGGAGTYNQPSTCAHPLCSGFGEHIKNLGFNCQFYDGCIGWQNLYAEEESNVDTFLISNFNFVGFDSHGFGAQNFGPILNAEVYTGSGSTSCGAGTVGGYVGDAEMRGLNGWTINNSSESDGNVPACTGTPIAALLLDAPNTEVRNGHCEGFLNCVLMGANNGPGGGNLGASGEQVIGVGGPPTTSAGNTVVQISGNYPSNSAFTVERIRANGDPNTIVDNINNVTFSGPFTALYSYAGIRAGAIATGVLASTDLAGQCVIGGTPDCTAGIAFSQSYTNPPICTCSDTSGIHACRVQVNSTTVTITGTSLDTIDYICIGRN